MQHIKKRLLIAASIVILTLSILFIPLYLQNDSRQFKKFTDELFTAEVASNTLNMHYTIAYPESYDITYEPHLSVYSSENRQSSIEELENILHFLSNISPSKLSEEDAYAYDLLTIYLSNALEKNKLSLYDDPLSPSSGAQTGLPILLADYTFRSVTDIEDYLSILDDIDDYMEGLICFEQEKADAGLFMSDYSVEKVIRQCDTIMDREALESGNHFLYTTFEERLQPLMEQGLITADEKQAYIALNDRLLTTVVAPAYEKTGDALTLLKGSGVNDAGLSYYPKGQEYYTLLLRSSTGSYRDMAEIKTLLYENFESSFDSLIQLVSSYKQTAEVPLQDITLPEFDSTESMLEHLQQQLEGDFPAFPLTAGAAYPDYTIKNVSELMAPYTSPAYYLTPPIDDISQNIIYINPNNAANPITLYTTLAHEGYPGHLYQTVYSQLYMDQKNENSMRYLLHYGGYVEGWALYVEMMSYDYLYEYIEDALASSEDALVSSEDALVSSDDALVSSKYTVDSEIAASYSYLLEYYRLNRSLQLCMYSLLDIAIHYDGADLAQVQKILATIGITDSTTTEAIFEYIVEEPGNYPKYYMGYLEILELKEKAKTAMGAEYSDYNFHQFILEAGPSDFLNLEKKLYEITAE